MNNQALVSVIIPVYNRFDLLEKTLLSVKEQDYVNFEVILIDDCSETKLDLKKIQILFGNNTVIYKRLDENSGPGIARRNGREISSGEYIAYLDSDDLWSSHFLSRSIEKFELFPDVSMVFTNVQINRGEERIRRLNIEEGIYSFFDLIFNKKLYWATGAAVWRRNISLSANWKPIRDHEDYVHDILSLQNNPKIFHISDMLCIVNKNSALGIERSNKDMLEGINTLLKSNSLNENLEMLGVSDVFFNFVLLRISKRNYYLKDISNVLKTYMNCLRRSKDKKSVNLWFVKMFLKNLNF